MKFWEFKNKTEDTGELMIYGDIANDTFWGDEVTPKEFKKELDALGNIKNLNIYINSSGGNVFAGQAIKSMLERHTAYKTVYIDGLAASIASVIAMIGDEVVIYDGSMMVIHNAMIGLMGMYNENQLIEFANKVKKINDSVIIPSYTNKTGKTEEEIQKMLDAETWMSAQDAVDMGFADRIEQNGAIAASIEGGFLIFHNQKFDLERYKNMPKIGKTNAKNEENTENTEEEIPPKPITNENGGESQPISDTLSAQKQQLFNLRKKINQI